MLYIKPVPCFYKAITLAASALIIHKAGAERPLIEVSSKSNARRRWFKSWYFCVCIACLKDNIMMVFFACDGTSPADESKRTKRVLGWSRQNWLGGYTHCCFLV